MTIGANVLTNNPIPADAMIPATFSSTNIVAEKVTRQGLYSEYEVDIVQEVDDATSSFKSAKETKAKKGKIKVRAGCDQVTMTLLFA